jgi:hypothetical protein
VIRGVDRGGAVVVWRLRDLAGLACSFVDSFVFRVVLFGLSVARTVLMKTTVCYFGCRIIYRNIIKVNSCRKDYVKVYAKSGFLIILRDFTKNHVNALYSCN